MSNPLLTTKLYIPRQRTAQRFVPRLQLVTRLNEALLDRLTLVSAPAGFGKTTLLSEWIPQSPRCVAWVSLDAGDNDPIRFRSYAIAALQMLQPSLGQSALTLLQSPQPPALESILVWRGLSRASTCAPPPSAPLAVNFMSGRMARFGWCVISAG